MGAVNMQSAIVEYHQVMTQMGMDMHTFHANWHQNNRDPRRPNSPDANFGTTLNFGNNFLQMHHEMVKAKDNDQKFFMHHSSIVSWFQSMNYNLPQEWNPLSPIPAELAFNPKDQSLRRTTNNPLFSLPKYFTLEGIVAGESPEPITGAKKLADFKNLNQLGCCIVYPHNAWHGAIGGAMLYFNTAIDDPIFYFGVHWHIDKVYDAYKNLPHVFTLDATAEERTLPTEFTNEQISQLKTWEELGLKISH